MLVADIIETISGEPGCVIPQGACVTLVRFQGCNLNCAWCDAPETQPFDGGIDYTPEEIVKRCKSQNVLITGGEPLLQNPNEFEELINILCGMGKMVQVETNGSYELPFGSLNLGWEVDIKCPSSGMIDAMPAPCEYDLYNLLVKYNTSPVDVKFVISDKNDLNFAMEYVNVLINSNMFLGVFVFSPVDSNPFVFKMILDYLPNNVLDRSILCMQLHKMVGLP